MREDYRKKAVRRLHIIAGQVRGLENMINEGKYCIDIITQSAAVKEALSGLEDLILEHHLKTHVVDQMKSGAQEKVTREILSVYKASRKK